MAVAEDHGDTVTIILAGYKDNVENKLYVYNAGLPSRFQSVAFVDFSEDQLGQIWRLMGTEQGWRVGDDVSRVAAARIARERGRKGFSNARSVRQVFERSSSRSHPASNRLHPLPILGCLFVRGESIRPLFRQKQLDLCQN